MLLGHMPPPPPQPLQQSPSGPSLQSTVGVVSSQWPLFSHNFGSMLSVAQPLPTTVLDFAGQLEYLTTHKVRIEIPAPQGIFPI